jgi:hypothetical protein
MFAGNAARPRESLESPGERMVAWRVAELEKSRRGQGEFKEQVAVPV